MPFRLRSRRRAPPAPPDDPLPRALACYLAVSRSPLRSRAPRWWDQVEELAWGRLLRAARETGATTTPDDEGPRRT